jgi:hypothetical protein
MRHKPRKLLWKQDLGILNAGWFYDPDTRTNSR